MKKLLATLFICQIGFGQINYDIIAKETCECIVNKKLDPKSKDAQMSFGLCLLEAYNKNTKDVKESEKINILDEANMEKMGMEVGMKMINYCPDIILAIGQNMYDEKPDAPSVAVAEAPQKKVLTVEGEYIGRKPEQFVTLQLKDKSNLIQNFIFLEYFESAYLITNEVIKPKNKLKISYSEVEFYDPKLKEFRVFKVINGLEKI